MSFKSNLILFLIFNSILIEICDSMFTAKFKNMNEDGCKEYGFQCDGESVKFKNEKIEHLSKNKYLYFNYINFFREDANTFKITK